MPVDDFFTKPGAIPFKWEIRPGVPKTQTQQKQHHRKQLSPPSLPSPSPPFTPRRSTPLPSPQQQPHHQKLKPPPAGFIYLPLPEPRTRSFRSAPRTRSRSWRSESVRSTRLRPDCVSPGCFPSPLLKRKDSKRRANPVPEPESDYISDLETRPRWSFSSRNSISPFRESSASSSFSSYQSSHRVTSDAEWAGFALF